MKIKFEVIVIISLIIQLIFFILSLCFNQIKILHLLSSIFQIITAIGGFCLIFRTSKLLQQKNKKANESARKLNIQTANKAINRNNIQVANSIINRNNDSFPLQLEHLQLQEVRTAMGISLRGLTCSICGMANTDGNRCKHLSPSPWVTFEDLHNGNINIQNVTPTKVRKLEFISRRQNGTK
jgi:hypothetical protein